MNERIKELYSQAVQYTMDNAGRKGQASSNRMCAEKFAELIVLECANELIRWKNEPFPYDPEFGAKLIRDHFGVKE
jgi:hypothetical protein